MKFRISQIVVIFPGIILVMIKFYNVLQCPLLTCRLLKPLASDRCCCHSSGVHMLEYNMLWDLVSWQTWTAGLHIISLMLHNLSWQCSKLTTDLASTTKQTIPLASILWLKECKQMFNLEKSLLSLNLWRKFCWLWAILWNMDISIQNLNLQ